MLGWQMASKLPLGSRAERANLNVWVPSPVGTCIVWKNEGAL